MNENAEELRSTLNMVGIELGIETEKARNLSMYELRDFIIKEIHVRRIILEGSRKNSKRLERENYTLRQLSLPYNMSQILNNP